MAAWMRNQACRKNLVDLWEEANVSAKTFIVSSTDMGDITLSRAWDTVSTTNLFVASKE